ncbi:MAG TPA: acyl-CoA dehydrogenase [Gammaproteobacteria bacterium]|nr:acyl-CoA dehydrogenase [Gammaproteobacteria bacterium]
MARIISQRYAWFDSHPLKQVNTVFWILSAIAVAWALAYIRASLAVATLVAAAFLILCFLITPSSSLAIIFISLIFILIALPLNLPALRQRWISAPVLRIFRKIMPSVSQTEREALEAGTVWWDGELFSGKPHWKKLLSLAPATLSEEEQAFLDGPVEELCQMLDDWKITHDILDLPEDVWQFLKDQRFFSMIIPKHYGGLGFSTLAHSAVVVKIASRSGSAAGTVMVPNSLGPAELLLHYGTEDQKDYYLPRLASGKEIPCFALTAPEAGSDAAAMPDRGILCKGEFQGENDVLGIRLDWEKRYTTLAPIATVLGLAFKLYDPEHLLGDKEDIGITLALIPVDTPGISIGRRHIPLNMMFQNGPHSGKDVFIPVDWIIGGPPCAGKGWRMLMERLAVGRSVSLPASSTAIAKLSCRFTGAYARVRTQFQLPIGYFEGVDEALARIAGYTYMMDAARIVTVNAVDAGEQPSVVSAIVKYHSTENIRKVVNDAMDVLAGAGISLGPRNMLGPCYQSVPVGITVEGANILTRSLIIFGQGAVRSHPYVYKEMQAVSDTDSRRALRNFDKALFGHVGLVIGNLARTLFMGLTGGHFIPPPVSGAASAYYQRLERMSSAFSLTADVTMLSLGGALKRKEKLSGRLADVFSHLYLASCVLKHYEDQGRLESDTPLMRWACEQSLYEIQQAFNSLLQNFPNRPLAWLLRLLIFPGGQAFKAPNDKLGHKIASLIMEPSAARDRLTHGIFQSDSVQDPLGRVEDALSKVIAAEPIRKRIHTAIREKQLPTDGPDEEFIDQAVKENIISNEEAELVRTAVAARREVIKVDDFPPDLSSGEPVNNSV